MSKTESRNEEVRKIQFSGKSSFMLSLPKRWVEELKLGAGDQVTVVRQGGTSLLIMPKVGKAYGLKAGAVITVSPGDSPDSLARNLISVYLLGYNSIHVKAKEGTLTSSLRDAIKEGMRRHLIGTEIIADSSEGMTLQVLLSYPELGVKDVVKRMFLLATSMHRDAIRALTTLSKDTAEGIIKTDDEVDRFSLYAIRQLNIGVENEVILKELDLATRRDCVDYRLIVKSVERVADHAGRIAEGVITLESPPKEPLLSKLTKMSEYAVDLFDDSGLALFKQDHKAADKVVEQAKLAAEMQKDLLNAIAKSRVAGSNSALPLIVEDMRRMAEYASDIAEVVINMSTETTAAKEETHVQGR